MYCIQCGRPYAYLAIPGYEHLGPVCSAECARPIWDEVNMMTKRPREEEDEDQMYRDLERLLRDARDNTAVVEAQDPNATQRIAQSLRQWGCAFVNVPAAPNGAIRRMTGAHAADAFVRVPDPIKADLRAGDFSSLLRVLKASGSAEQLQIWGKGIGMLNRAPIGPASYQHVTSRDLGLVHAKNPLAALNNVHLWSMLPQQLHPDRWYVPQLRSPGRPRVFVPDDGIKVKQRQTYGPTALHYDGQLGDATGAEANRVQVVYCDDVGPVRLCVVPASHTPAVRDLIQRISGIRADRPDFDTASAQLKQHPRLLDLLKRYGVALPGSGLLMFVSNVWHFEGAVVVDGDPARPLQAMEVEVRPLTRQADVFRIYCGVVAVHNTTERVKELVEMAYWREHQWTLEPFHSGNKRYELFVNHKVANAVKRRDVDAAERQEFGQLDQLSYQQKQAWVFANVPPDRLGLYGLSLQDAAVVQDEVQIYE